METLSATSDAQTDPAMPGADDLLAQLAGEDIDKLLAEAEVEAAPASAAAAPGESAQAEAAPPPPTSEAAVTADEEVAKNLDELFEEIKKEEAPPPSATPAESPAVVARADPDAAAAMESEPSLPPVGDAAANQAVELSQDTAPPADASEDSSASGEAAEAPLSGSDVAASAAPIKQAYDTTQPASGGEKTNSQEPVGALATGADEERLPFYIRFLEFLNSPLEGLSDPVREIIGKIALVTLLNSIVVIGYVLLFRRK